MLCPLSPECEIECPERLTTALERLQQHGLKQRCLQLVAREASEAELGLVHRSSAHILRDGRMTGHPPRYFEFFNGSAKAHLRKR